MAAITRANIAKQLLPGLNAVFGVEYGMVDDEHLPLFEIENSERAFEEEVLFTGFGTAPTKDEGAAVEYDNAQEAWTSRYTMETIALAFSITEEAMEDNLYDTFARVRAKALARAMANTKQVKGANVFNNGFNTAYPGGDNVPLFSASHPTIGAGNFSNTTAVDLSETALENALINISLYKDDRGILIGAKGVSLHIPPQLQFVADRLLMSPGRVGTTDNDINAIKSMGMLPGGYHTASRTPTRSSSRRTPPTGRRCSTAFRFRRRWSRTSTRATCASRPASVTPSAGLIGVVGMARRARPDKSYLG